MKKEGEVEMQMDEDKVKKLEKIKDLLINIINNLSAYFSFVGIEENFNTDTFKYKFHFIYKPTNEENSKENIKKTVIICVSKEVVDDYTSLSSDHYHQNLENRIKKYIQERYNEAFMPDGEKCKSTAEEIFWEVFNQNIDPYTPIPPHQT